MNKFQTITQEGNRLLVKRAGRLEQHDFKSDAEAKGRLGIIEEAFSWLGTPFVNNGDIKGPNGAVDCAMLLRRCYVDTGRLEAFDPRPYPPSWHVHQSEELFIKWIEKLGGIETDKPQLADIAIYQFGRCFSHGAVIVNSKEIVHAFAGAGMCLLSRMDEPVLAYRAQASQQYPRPIRFYNVWG